MNCFEDASMLNGPRWTLGRRTLTTARIATTIMRQPTIKVPVEKMLPNIRAEVVDAVEVICKKTAFFSCYLLGEIKMNYSLGPISKIGSA